MGLAASLVLSVHSFRSADYWYGIALKRNANPYGLYKFVFFLFAVTLGTLFFEPDYDVRSCILYQHQTQPVKVFFLPGCKGTLSRRATTFLILWTEALF